MKTLKLRFPTAARLLLGGIFLIFGLNGFFQFLPMPPPSGTAAAYMGGLAATGYFFPLLKGTEILAGLLLLAGRRVPLALTVLAPIVVQIFAFHLFLAPAGLGLAAALVGLEIYLAWVNRAAFAGLVGGLSSAREYSDTATSRS